MSSPWMPFFIGDYLRDTRSLTLEEHGAYMLLIMEYWSNGGLPKNDEKIAQILGISRTKFKGISPNIKRFFSENWEHKRIDEELQKTKERSDKARNSINKRWSKSNTKEVTNVYSNEDTSVDTNVILPQPQPQLIDKSIKKTNKKDFTAPAGAVREAFERFWAVYPKKRGKDVAIKNFDKAVKAGVDPADLIAAAERYAKEVAGFEDRFIKYPQGWLTEGRWKDEPSSRGPPAPQKASGFQFSQAGRTCKF